MVLFPNEGMFHAALNEVAVDFSRCFCKMFPWFECRGKTVGQSEVAEGERLMPLRSPVL